MPITPSGDILASTTSTAHDVTSIAHGNRRIPVLHRVINENTSGDRLLVSGVAGKIIVVLSYNFMSNGAVNAHFRSASTPITGPAYMSAAGSGKVAPYNPHGWARTVAGENLNLNLSASVGVGGELTYALLDA